jgi:hypothetical protein
VLSEAANAEGEKAAPGLCGVKGYPERMCNLYVEHYGSEPGNPGWPKLPTFIARLSSGDEPDWVGLGVSEGAKSGLTSRVSPNGRYLAFMSGRAMDRQNPRSEIGDWQGGVGHRTAEVTLDGRYLVFVSDASLTGYDNRDAKSGVLDEEVFEYDAAIEKLMRVSIGQLFPAGV